MVRMLDGIPQNGITVFCPLELSRAIEWAGKNDPRKLSKGRTVFEIFSGNSVHGCRTAPELLSKYRKATKSEAA